MNLLSAILPGFRTLRTPVIAGFIWLANILVFIVVHRIKIPINQSDLSEFSKLLPNWVSIIVIPVSATAAYLLGSIMVGVTTPILLWGGSLYRRRVARLLLPAKSKSKTRNTWNKNVRKLSARSSLVSSQARSQIADYIITTFIKAGATSISALVFPLNRALLDLPISAAQLAQSESPQYQEYDRLQSEAAFRLGVVIPLFLLACQLPIKDRAILIVATAAGSMVLLVQSVTQTRRANDILAAAAYLGHVSLVQVQAISEYLRQIQPPPKGDPESVGAIISGLQRYGYFEFVGDAINELLQFDEPDFIFEARDYAAKFEPEVAVEINRMLTQTLGHNAVMSSYSPGSVPLPEAPTAPPSS